MYYKISAGHNKRFSLHTTVGDERTQDAVDATQIHVKLHTLQWVNVENRAFDARDTPKSSAEE